VFKDKIDVFDLDKIKEDKFEENKLMIVSINEKT